MLTANSSVCTLVVIYHMFTSAFSSQGLMHSCHLPCFISPQIMVQGIGDSQSRHPLGHRSLLWLGFPSFLSALRSLQSCHPPAMELGQSGRTAGSPSWLIH